MNVHCMCACVLYNYTVLCRALRCTAFFVAPFEESLDEHDIKSDKVVY